MSKKARLTYKETRDECTARYKLRIPSWIQFTPESPCEIFLDLLIEAVHSEPPFMRARDTQWVIAFLEDFKRFKPKWWAEVREVPSDEISRLPLAALPELARQWIQNHFNQDHHPLAATYALATTELISAHYHGKFLNTLSNKIFTVQSILLEEDFATSHLYGRSFGLDDPAFKREITRRISGIKAVVKVPENGSVGLINSDTQSIGPGKKFLFRIERSHLSSGRFDFSHITATEDFPNGPEFDFFDSFRFRGALLASKDEPHYHPMDLIMGDIPVTWITHVLENTVDQSPLAVPDWKFDKTE